MAQRESALQCGVPRVPLVHGVNTVARHQPADELYWGLLGRRPRRVRRLRPRAAASNGGAIAIGHPLGCSGARILTTQLWELRRRGGGVRLAAMCVVVGQGIAVVVQT